MFLPGLTVHCFGFGFRVFGGQAACTVCGHIIPPSDYVMRVEGSPTLNLTAANQPRGSHIYHLNCFNCIKCNSRLQQGEKFCVLTNGHLVCENDWPIMLKGTSGVLPEQHTIGTTVRKGKVGRPRRSRD